jgi:hypothetical protein
MYLDKKSAVTIPHSENALADLHLAPSLIKLSREMMPFFEMWYVENTGELDLLASLADECHDPAPLDWDDRTIAELYGALDHMIKL